LTFALFHHINQLFGLELVVSDRTWAGGVTLGPARLFILPALFTGIVLHKGILQICQVDRCKFKVWYTFYTMAMNVFLDSQYFQRCLSKEHDPPFLGFGLVIPSKQREAFQSIKDAASSISVSSSRCWVQQSHRDSPTSTVLYQ
jgi:hypothetical protein